MPATIKDIARKLNLSVSTVSYALNDGPRPVSEEIRAKVKRVARELEYRPNMIARSLVTRRSGMIGVVLPGLEPNPLANVFIRDTLNGIMTEAEAVGLNVLLFTAYSIREIEAYAKMAEAGLDGMVLLAPFVGTPAICEFVRRQTPCVVVAAIPEQPVPSFTVDNAYGTRLAMQHLWDLGHRRIAHLAGRRDHYDSEVRSNEYSAFLAQRGGTDLTTEITYGDFRKEGAMTLAMELLTQNPRPTAIFSSNDAMALAIIDVAQGMGLSIPRDLSVVGFDDGDIASTANLTTVAQPFHRMGSEALLTIFRLLEGSQEIPSVQFVPSLVIRASTSSPFKEENK